MAEVFENKGPGEVTRLLLAARDGEREAFDQLFPLVYDELRRMAGRQLSRERREHTLQPTALVNEAYLKLVDQTQVEWKSRAHFVGIAARAMRQILIDYARKRGAHKRGGGWERATLDEELIGVESSLEELLALDAALNKLAEFDERLRRVVEYRYFGGLSEKEIGELLGVTPRTVERDWAKARAWLHKELYTRGEMREG